MLPVKSVALFGVSTILVAASLISGVSSLSCWTGSSSSKAKANCTEEVVNCFTAKQGKDVYTFSCGDDKSDCSNRWGPKFENTPCTVDYCNDGDPLTKGVCVGAATDKSAGNLNLMAGLMVTLLAAAMYK